jgi:thiol-disulfide isomerase/thioredoxin
MQRLLYLFVLLWAAACTTTAAVPGDQATADPAVTPSVEPLAAPDFTLNALGGDIFTLSEQRGRWVVVNFWATWCEPCKVEMPDLQRISTAFGDRLVLVGINMRESAQEVRAFADEFSIRYPILLEPDDGLLTSYLVMGLPLTVVIDPEGNIAMRQFGPVDPDFQAMLVEIVN